MKIKALIITAALVVAGAASSMAQVYSANAVGYVNMSLPVGLSLIANPLNNGDNNLDVVLPLGEDDVTGVGTTIYRFNTDTQAYGEALQWATSAVGWFDPSPVPDPAWKILDPGEGFFIQCLVPLNVTFVGDVPQGSLSNPMPGDTQLSIRSSQVPQEAGIGHVADGTGAAAGLEFPATTGDTLFIWKSDTQRYDEPWQYAETLGWVQVRPELPEPVILPDGPVIPVGQAFFIQKFGPGMQVWARQFSVN